MWEEQIKYIGIYQQISKDKIIKGKDPLTNVIVAIKEMNDNQIFSKREQFFVAHLLGLKLPNVVEYYEIIRRNQREYLIMENCECTLTEINVPDSVEEQICLALEIGSQIIQGLQSLYNIFGEGFLHRDLKPDNIFFKDNFYKIGDFDCSIISKNSDTSNFDNSNNFEIQQSIEIGTLGYKAPELNKGYYDNKCDVYSLGMIMKQLVPNIYENQNYKDLQIYTKFQKLMKYMTEQNPKDRISFQELKNTFSKKQQFLRINLKQMESFLPKLDEEQVFNTSITISDKYKLVQYPIDGKIKQINELFNNILKYPINNIQTRMILNLWIKIIDKGWEGENNQDKKQGLIQIKRKIQIQQIQMIKSDSNSIEFQDLKSTCLLINKQHFQIEKSLKIELKNLINDILESNQNFLISLY